MTLTELRYLIAVAREHHFGRAAEACFVSQPTLSVAIRKLEEELGITLFERGTTEISITSMGERIIAQAQRVLAEVDTLKHLAAQGQNELQGTLRLGVIYTIGPYLLPHLIPRLHHSAAQMPLQIEENFTANLSERLKQGTLDAAILSLPYSGVGILTEALYEEPFIVLIPRHHPLEATVQISPRELAHQDLLLLGAGHCFRDQVLQFCPECNRLATAGDNMQKTLEGSSLETIRLMVASGMGVTVLPQTSVTNYPYTQDMVTVRPFTPPVPKRIVALAWRKGFPRPQAIQVLADAVRDCPLGDAITMLSPQTV